MEVKKFLIMNIWDGDFNQHKVGIRMLQFCEFFILIIVAWLHYFENFNQTIWRSMCDKHLTISTQINSMIVSVGVGITPFDLFFKLNFYIISINDKYQSDSEWVNIINFVCLTDFIVVFKNIWYSEMKNTDSFWLWNWVFFFFCETDVPK